MQQPDIFAPDLDFEITALEIFRLQARENLVYQNYLQQIRIDISSIQKVEQIPYLPIRMFKSHRVIAGSNEVSTIFTSSGTTGAVTSSHFVTDVALYEQSFTKTFKKLYGDLSSCCFIALLPSYLERSGSSLVYMCEKLMGESKHPDSGFYLNEYDKLAGVIKQLEEKKQKTILLGVTYALLDFAKLHPMPLRNTIVLETGGMKGKREEMIRSEVHAILQQAFSIEAIHSEYGMTELLSQAYSDGNGIYKCPPWMRVFARDTNDPLSVVSAGKSGGLNIIDLANFNSCSFIATQDLGRIHLNGSFEVLGRFDDAEIRGCNLMVE